MKKIILIVLLSSLNAQAATSTFIANATLNNTCKVSTSNVDFGVMEQASPGIYGSSNNISKVISLPISVLCNNKTAFNISGLPNINKGGVVARFLSGSAGNNDSLTYAVYTQPSVLDQYGVDGTKNLNRSLNSTGTGSQQTLNLYFGLGLPKNYPGYYVKPDVYTDNYTITLSY